MFIGLGTWWVWLQFVLCLAVIGYAGMKVSVYGDVIADKTGLGGSWVGVVLLATVTSLPELANGISSVSIADVPDIAIGDVLGSCIFNLLVLVVLDSLLRGDSIYRRASRGHILAGGFGIMLIGLSGLSLVLTRMGMMVNLGHIGLYTPAILLIYVAAMHVVFRYERRQVATFTEKEPDRYPQLVLRQAILRYGVAATAGRCHRWYMATFCGQGNCPADGMV